MMGAQNAFESSAVDKEVENPGFWQSDEEIVDPQRPGTIRVLVCGNTGVGKSTLINKVFGVEAVSPKARHHTNI